MKWSMDTHKYMSEITRTALQILADNNITSASSPEEIEAAERKLAHAGVYRDFDGAKGRIRRALFTYFKAYDCMTPSEQLTEVGKAFVENKLSIQEISFYYVTNYLYKDREISYYPLRLIMECLYRMYKTDPKEAYLTAYDFSLIVDCDSYAQINDTFVAKLLNNHKSETPAVNERTIGYDVWAKMITQAGILSFENHTLKLRNVKLAEWILNAYKQPFTKQRGILTSGILNYLPTITTGKPKGDPAIYAQEGKALQALLFDDVPVYVIEKYITVDSKVTVYKMFEALGLTFAQAGFYSVFSGLEHLVGHTLYRKGTPLQRTIGEILLNLEVTPVEHNDEDSECEEAQDPNIPTKAPLCNKELPTLSPRTRKNHPLNSILYGAPGTGKTYSSAQYALAIVENKRFENVAVEDRKAVMQRYNKAVSEGHIVFTTFHQSYGYEDFIQGIRPDTTAEGMSFKTVDGVFKAIADKAMLHPEQDFVIIIDEINRANISKVFGELITLIEGDKRWGEVNAIDATLPSGEIFAVPNNLYILGTMNSADKSISLIDTALRRRFDFIEFEPKASLVADLSLRKVLERLNGNIAGELGSTDLLIGHSYFMNKKIDDLCDIMNRNIIPLLYEYFFDNQKKVEAQVKAAIEGFDVAIKTGTVGRIKLVKKGAE